MPVQHRSNRATRPWRGTAVNPFDAAGPNGCLERRLRAQIPRFERRARHAGRQEITMAGADRFEIPPEMRAFAEKSVEQARQAFDGFISAAQQAMSAFEGQAETARKGA